MDALGGLLTTGALGVVAVLVLALFRRHPRVAFAAWLAALGAVPVWVGVSLVIDLEPHVPATLAALAALLLAAPAGREVTGIRLTVVDGVVALVVLAGAVAFTGGGTSFSDTFVLCVQWLGAYLLGRLIAYRVGLPWVYGAVAVAFTAVALLALLEFLTGWNPFVTLPGSGSLHDAWSPIQLRGGQARAEGAFGHSIALGTSLALALPLTLAAPFRAWVRMAMAVALISAAAVTFSRAGLATAAFGVVLTVVFLRTGLSRRVRALVSAGVVVAAVGFASLVSDVFDAAGDEATGSAGYRWLLLDLVPHMRPLGLSEVTYWSPTGQRYYGPFRSIDNALVLLGLNYGWAPLALVLALLLLAVGCVLTGRATAPTVALVAQIPAFVSVALITQYATFTWFVAGLAVCSQAMAAGRPEPPRERLPDLPLSSPEMGKVASG